MLNARCWSRAPQLQEKLLYQNKKVKGNSTWSGREERAQPLHLRKRRRQEGSATLINGKGATSRGIEDKGQKGRNWGIGAHTHVQRRNRGRLQKAVVWRKAVVQSTHRPTITVRVFGLLLGEAHSVVTWWDLQATYISMYFVLWKIRRLSWLVVASCRQYCKTLRKSRAMVLLLSL